MKSTRDLQLLAGERRTRLRHWKGSHMRRLLIVGELILGGVLAWGADWLTDGGNPERTAWQRDEKVLTTANVKDMKLLWKIKLDNQPRQMHSLLPALVVGRVSTSAGPKQIVVVAGVSDN